MVLKSHDNIGGTVFPLFFGFFVFEAVLSVFSTNLMHGAKRDKVKPDSMVEALVTF